MGFIEMRMEISSLTLQMEHHRACPKLGTGERQDRRGSGAYLLGMKLLKLWSLRKTARWNSIHFRYHTG